MKKGRFFGFLKYFGYFLIGAVIGIFLLIGLACFIVFSVRRDFSNKIYPGISLFTESISGKTPQELEGFLAEKEKALNQRKIILEWMDKSGKKWEITPLAIDFSINKEKTIKEAMDLGRKAGLLENLFKISQLLIYPQEVKTYFHYDDQKLADFFKPIAMEVNQPVQEGLFEFKQGKVTNFQPSNEGRELDTKEIKSQIVVFFSQGKVQSETINRSLVIVKTYPKIDTNASNQLGIKELLGEGESFFLDSIPARVHNILVASKLMHGIVIPPGETFSFAEKIGDISAKTGYEQAYVIKSGKTVLDDGGGVCQVSTTLFRAALNAGLPIVERRAHAYRVGFYEQGAYPPGLDATVYPPNPDFKFKNDTPAYLLIQLELNQVKKRLVFKFYGTSDARKTEMTKPVILSQTPPPDPIYVDDPTMAVGTEKKFDSAHWGAKVSFTRKVFNADGTLKEEKTFASNYTPWPAVYFRGTKI